MKDKELREKAIAYESLSVFFSNDRDKAYRTLESLKIDYSLPFASYTKAFTSTYEEEERFNTTLRETREAFDRVKINYSISEYDKNPYFFYYTGDSSLLQGKKLCFLGAVMPSLAARKETALCVIEAIKNGYTIVAPFESGLGPYALSVAIKEEGKTIAVLSSELTKCPNEALLPLMETIYEKGMLLTEFSPRVKREKWHVVLRNRFLASFADGFFLAEEKDGGPSWPVFDEAIKLNKPVAISGKIVGNSNYSWCDDRAKRGALVVKKPSDIKKLFPLKRRVKRSSFKENEGDLFSFFGYDIDAKI